MKVIQGFSRYQLKFNVRTFDPGWVLIDVYICEVTYTYHLEHILKEDKLTPQNEY